MQRLKQPKSLVNEKILFWNMPIYKIVNPVLQAICSVQNLRQRRMLTKFCDLKSVGKQLIGVNIKYFVKYCKTFERLTYPVKDFENVFEPCMLMTGIMHVQMIEKTRRISKLLFSCYSYSVFRACTRSQHGR